MAKRGTVYQRGKVFWIKYYRNGKPYFESSKSTKKMVANKLLEQRLGEIAQGKMPGIHFDKVTFEELKADLETDYGLKGQGRPRVWHLEKVFGDMRAVDITTAKIKEFIQIRLDEGAANATVNRELAALKRMFNLGKQDTPPKVYMVPYFPMLKVNNVKQGFFEDMEFETHRDSLPSYLKEFAAFGYLTGWRIEEIAGLTWDRVDIKNRTVKLNPGETKNKEGRNMYMEDALVVVMEGQLADKRKNCPYVFHRDGQRLGDIRYPWNRACRETGLGWGYKLNNKYVKKWEEKGLKEGPTFHDFRRTAVRNMERAGVPRKVAMLRTGHKTEAVYNRYNITNDDDLKMAAEKLDRYRNDRDRSTEDATQSQEALLLLYLMSQIQNGYKNSYNRPT